LAAFSSSIVSIDTGVFVEFIDDDGAFHAEATAVLESIITSGRLSGLVAHPVYAELYCVAGRLYEKLRKKGEEEEDDLSPEIRTEKLVEWLFGSPNLTTPERVLSSSLCGREDSRKATGLPSPIRTSSRPRK
jgi:predicted nucleic acid-binding protein